MFDDFATSDVLFLFIEMRSLNNFSHNDEIRQCLMIWQHPMSFFSSSRSDHWTISLSRMRFVNVWWFGNIRCPFSLHRDEIIEQFLLARWDSWMFDDFATSDAFFLFIEMRSLNNFSHNDEIRQCLMIDEEAMYHLYWWKCGEFGPVGIVNVMENDDGSLWIGLVLRGCCEWGGFRCRLTSTSSSSVLLSKKEFVRDPFSSETNSWCDIYNLAMSTSDDFCK